MGFVPFKSTRMREAIDEGNTATVKALLARGVDPGIRDDYGRSFLWYAINKDRRDIAEELIAKGAALQDTDGGSGTLLHLAARRGRLELAGRLLELCPALLNRKDGYGETPLHVAAENGHEDVAAFLIEKNADVYAKNDNGRTPLFLAQRENRVDLAALLKKAMKPESAAPEPKAETGADWHRLADDRIAHVTVDAAIGYRITDIFNFAAQERTTLYQNIETRVESNAVRRFDEIGDPAIVELAAQQLKALGGAEVLASTLPKKRLSGPQEF